MRLAWFALIALLLSLLQHGPLAGWTVAPDLPLALAAWAMVDGDDDGVLLRAWLVGVIHDLVDPGTGYGRGHDLFHAIAYACLGLAFIPARSWLFRSRALGWGGWAFACALAVSLVDHRLGGVPIAYGPVIASAALTGGAAMAIGWLLGGLPESVRPLRTGAA